MSKETGCEPDFFSWQGILPTIPDRMLARPYTVRIDTETVARY